VAPFCAYLVPSIFKAREKRGAVSYLHRERKGLFSVARDRKGKEISILWMGTIIHLDTDAWIGRGREKSLVDPKEGNDILPRRRAA